MRKLEDWIVMTVMLFVIALASYFLLKHPDATNFATWSGTVTIVGGVFHWLTQRDDKIPDKGEDDK